MPIFVTVLLTVLKVVGWILLGLLALILIALLIPVGAQVRFADGKLTIKAKAGPVSITVFPRPRKKKRRPPESRKGQKKEKKAPEKQSAPAETPAPPEIKPEQTGAAPEPQKETAVPEKTQDARKSEPETQPQETQIPVTEAPKPEQKRKEKPPEKQKAAAAPPKESKGLSAVPWAKITAALELLPTVLKKLFAAIRIYDIRITFPVHGEDAAQTAVSYGRMNGLVGGTLAAAGRIFRLELTRLAVICDFTGERKGEEEFSLKITTHLLLLVILSVTTLIQLKRRKIL